MHVETRVESAWFQPCAETALFQPLKRKYDELLSNLASGFNSCPYMKKLARDAALPRLVSMAETAHDPRSVKCNEFSVRRRLIEDGVELDEEDVELEPEGELGLGEGEGAGA